jgi:NADH dehydrogenase (ubiquinone) Fe-S protein 1
MLDNKIRIEINGESYFVPPEETIIQSCYRVGLEIPRFCYHESLSIAGNCRMCLVEVAFPKSVKPVASCMMRISEDMRIFTDTMLVKAAREGVLEFLLANHPLDCPICDQGGECDLQDQALIFGSDRGRFYENKRATSDKELGPLIKTSMTRCIHCTRCVRFCSEIAGIEVLGTVGRGSLMEIGTYVEKVVDSEISANVIDLCPVGALTSKPYAFTARPWELRSIATIDVLDSFCSSIRVDIRGTDIMRILPLMNVQSNEEWISDKTRFFHDGLKYQRLQTPLLKLQKSFISIDWKTAFSVSSKFFSFFYRYSNNFFRKNSFDNILESFSLTVCVGKLVDIETLLVLKNFFDSVGGANFLFNDFLDFRNEDFRQHFASVRLLDFADIDCVFLLNFNPRLQFPILNTKLRRASLKQDINVVSIGQAISLNISFFNIAISSKNFLEFLEGKNFFCRLFLFSKKPIFLISSNIFELSEGFFYRKCLDYLFKFLKNSNDNFVNFINNFTSEVGMSELGLFTSGSSFIKTNKSFMNSFIYTLGSEISFFLEKNLLFLNNFLIYQGHHGDILTYFSDIIFPSSVFLEKKSTFLSYDGFLHKTKYVIPAPGVSQDDWLIVVCFFKFLQDFFHILLKDIDVFYKVNNHFFPKNIMKWSSFFDELFIENFSITSMDSLKTYDKFFNYSFNFSNFIFLSKNNNPYVSDSITKASEIMSLCTQRFLKNKNNFV